MTPDEVEVARRNLIAELKDVLLRDLDEYPIDARTLRDLVEVLEAVAPVEQIAQAIESEADTYNDPNTIAGMERASEIVRNHGGRA